MSSHRVFSQIAKRGKNSVGWFYGFKLHLIANDEGELLAVRLTSANVDDRTPVPKMIQKLFGKLYGEKAISYRSCLTFYLPEMCSW
ncbi:MAG: transposase [Candidatus Poribacteria bacterium]